MENPCGEPPTPPSPRLCSGGEESQHQAASGTRLEAFPQDCRSPQTTNASNSPSFSPIPKSFNFRGEAHIVPASPDGMDPFVTTGRGKGLSPTASTFQPFGGHLQVLNTKNVSEALSFDLGIYRAFYVSCSTTLSATQVESSLAVRLYPFSSKSLPACSQGNLPRSWIKRIYRTMDDESSTRTLLAQSLFSSRIFGTQTSSTICSHLSNGAGKSALWIPGKPQRYHVFVTYYRLQKLTFWIL